MAAPTERTLNYGLRFASIFALNTNGTPAGTNATAYEGIQVAGSTAFELNVPDARKLSGLGEDGVTQVVYLPPNEGADGKLNVEAADPTLAALLDGTLVSSVGEMSIVGIGTDKQGFEPKVGMMLYQAARGLLTGSIYWHTFFIPSAQVIRKSPGMTSDKGVTTYQIAPNKTTKHLWGPSFANGTEGFLVAQILEAWSNNPYRVAGFKGTGAAVDFNFPTDYPAVQTSGIKVYKNGTVVSSGITLATTKVTFAVAPLITDEITILREVAG
ncbi:MAG: hypothetical protein NTW69_06285 [Chloroflexi bacterium]|nr:hypothetical protein [Chloroflexota bacterium]